MSPEYGCDQINDEALTGEDHFEVLKLASSRQAWTKSRILGAFILTNVSVFILGVVVSHASPFTTAQGFWLPAASNRINGNHDHTTASSKASTTTMIDGLEVAGTRCGRNWHEAKAMGCHFDVMASRWYAPECFDQEVLEEMLAEPQINSSFTWYADKAHTIVVPSEKVFNGEFDKVYPDNLFHIKHCLHLWRKLHHAVLSGRPVDEDILDYGHTLHCTRMIMRWTEPGFERHSVTHAQSATPFCRSTLLADGLNSKE